MSVKTRCAPSSSDHITLYYRQGSSDKVYQARIEPAGERYHVHYAYGRRGATLQTGTKTDKPVEYPAARRILDKLVSEKTAKGYSPGEDGSPYQHTEREQRHTGVLPQLLNPMEESELERLLADDSWWMQEKLDGRRLLIRKAGTHLTAINRTGLTVGLAQAVADAVGCLPVGACLLDGEAVGEVYHAFDLLEREDHDLRSSPYAIRYESLLNLIDEVPSNHLRYVPVVVGTQRKRTALEQLRQDRKEGVVFKDSGAVYTAGRPARGGSQRKLKFYATASCLVSAVHGSKRSVALELLSDKGHRVGVGSVTIPLHQPIPAAGQIVEVRYLYAFPQGCLYQPVFLGRREDVTAQACTVGQLKLKGAEDPDSGG